MKAVEAMCFFMCTHIRSVSWLFFKKIKIYTHLHRFEYAKSPVGSLWFDSLTDRKSFSGLAHSIFRGPKPHNIERNRGNSESDFTQ